VETSKEVHVARRITISDGGGLSGFGSISMMQDTAEVLLEALSEVLGIEVDWDTYTYIGASVQNVAQCGTVTVTAEEV
jgi:hypothetical protein